MIIGINTFNKIAAGIVLYNPDFERLKENINSITPQIDKLVLVNNGIDNQSIESELLHFIGSNKKINLINNGCNYGVAYALNQICQWAKEQGYEWVLTLDQDSVCEKNMIEMLVNSKEFTEERVGILCPTIVFEKDGIVIAKTDKIQDPSSGSSLEACITSGSLTNIKAWDEVGGFDEWMFIDHVDNDFCRTLQNAHYRILRVSNAVLYQQAGEMKYRKTIFGKTILLPNYSEKRNYYISRNTIYFIRKHKRTISIMREILRFLYIELRKILYEKGKLGTIRSAIRGIEDGLKKKI